MSISIEASYEYMLFNELNRTRKELMREENEDRREILNNHFDNISKLDDELEEFREFKKSQNKRLDYESKRNPK